MYPFSVGRPGRMKIEPHVVQVAPGIHGLREELRSVVDRDLLRQPALGDKRAMVLALVSDAVFQNPGQPGRVDWLQQVVREPCLAAEPGVVVPPVARQRDEHRVLG